MKAPTEVVEIEGIQIAIPVGPIVQPTAEAERISQAHQDPRGWKYPQKPYFTYDKSIADDLCQCYDFYLGGHEIQIVRYDQCGTLYCVGSHGYYHYIGA